MQSKYLLLLGVVVMTILAACTGSPGTEQPTTSTACPPASTPERSMPKEAETIRTRLTDAGLDQINVGVTGFQNCPDIPTAEKPGWIDIAITVADPGDTAYLGYAISSVQAATVDWPQAAIHLNLLDANTNLIASFSTTGQDIESLQTQGITGAALYEKLVEQENSEA